MIKNEKFITSLKLKRKTLIPNSIYSKQFVSSFFFDFIDNENNYIALTFLMKNVFRIYLNVLRNQIEFIDYLRKFKDEFKDTYNYYQQLLITTKQHIYEESHVIACFFTFDNDLREILTIYVNELFCNFIEKLK
jgi:hypothetical protein